VVAETAQRTISLLVRGANTQPEQLQGPPNQFDFNRRIVDATRDLVAATSRNSASTKRRGCMDWRSLRRTVDYIHDTGPGAGHLDAKRGDIGSTAAAYARAASRRGAPMR